MPDDPTPPVLFGADLVASTLGSPSGESASRPARRRKVKLAEAKAHLAELVEEVELHGKPIVIVRDGKAAAAIVPVAAPTLKARRPMKRADAKALLDGFARLGDATGEAVRDLIESRR